MAVLGSRDLYRKRPNMSVREIEYEIRECGCKYEVIEPGKRWRINGLNKCGPHQRESLIRSDAMGAVDSLLYDCRYDDPSERKMWAEAAAEHLDAASFDPEFLGEAAAPPETKPPATESDPT